MSPHVVRYGSDAGGFPRVSGDEPAHEALDLTGGGFSPRERG